jgi:hypothetical protein
MMEKVSDFVIGIREASLLMRSLMWKFVLRLRCYEALVGFQSENLQGTAIDQKDQL